jgi:hypothetical protein
MPKVFWKCLFKVSRSPYEKPQRKKRVVTSASGYMDCLKESSAAFVLPFAAFSVCFLKIVIVPFNAAMEL